MFLRRITLPLILLACVASSVQAKDEKDKLSDFIVAKVNGEIITTADILKTIGPTLQAIEQNALLSAREKMNKKVILWTRAVRDEVEKIIALQAAKKVKTEVSEAEMKEEWQDFVRRLGGEKQAKEYADERGLTLNNLQVTLRQQLTVKKLIMEKIGLAQGQGKRRPQQDVFVRPREMQRYYQANRKDFELAEGVRIRQIFLSFAGKKKAEVRKLGHSLVGQLRKGADFGQLAQLYSPGPLARHGGRFPMEEVDGKLRWQHVLRGQLLAEVEQIAFALALKQISDPIEVAGKGVFVIRVEERREARVVPFSEAQKRIRLILLRKKVNAEVERVRRKLRAEATIWPPNLFEKLDLRFLKRG